MSIKLYLALRFGDWFAIKNVNINIKIIKKNFLNREIFTKNKKKQKYITDTFKKLDLSPITNEIIKKITNSGINNFFSEKKAKDKNRKPK